MLTIKTFHTLLIQHESCVQLSTSTDPYGIMGTKIVTNLWGEGISDVKCFLNTSNKISIPLSFREVLKEASKFSFLKVHIVESRDELNEPFEFSVGFEDFGRMEIKWRVKTFKPESAITENEKCVEGNNFQNDVVPIHFHIFNYLKTHWSEDKPTHSANVQES